MSTGGKLSVLEAERIVSVLDDAIEKIKLLEK